MSTVEEVEAAEARMNTTKETLLQYIERQGTIDRDDHQRLVTRFKRAQARFLKAISELGNSRVGESHAPPVMLRTDPCQRV